MKLIRIGHLCCSLVFVLSACHRCCAAETKPVSSPSVRPAVSRLERIKYNHPGLVVDLGVGLWAWPMPVDYDGDGDLDLVVSCSDKPYNGLYFFENPAGKGVKDPVFRPARRISRGLTNVGISHVPGGMRVLSPGIEHVDFFKTGLEEGQRLPLAPNIHPNRVRANQWSYVDYDGDGKLDLIVGVGDWTEYGWDNAFDAQGRWTRGPLHSRVYWLRNTGNNAAPQYSTPVALEAGGRVIDGFGMPSPCFADFDGDGDLDLICGEFLDGFTWFENVGTRREPRYAAGRVLVEAGGKPLKMDLCMITPTPIDWDGDGDVDLVVGQEDGRVALVENTGKTAGGMPVFLPPRFFRQEADEVKFGALATPVGFDWDGDGDEDIVCGNSAGYIGLIENLGGNPPRFAAPRYIEADGKVIRIEAGPNGSIQGPCEAKWGYTTLSVADWDGDGVPDLVVNSIWGKVHWYRNIGTRSQPRLAAAAPIEVEWNGTPPKPVWNWWTPAPNELATQWRTTPLAIDWTGDGLCDLVMLDHEGYLVLFERSKKDGRLVLLPPRRIFLSDDAASSRPPSAVPSAASPLQLNAGAAGRSGRRKLSIADWDGDGRPDLLVDSRNVNWFRNVGQREGGVLLRNAGLMDGRILAGHDTSPTTVDWNRDGVRDLLVGAEDGYLYYLKNPRVAKGAVRRGMPAEHLVAAWDFEPDRGGPLADKATAGSTADTLTVEGSVIFEKGTARVSGTAGVLLEAATSPDLNLSDELTIWLRLRLCQAPKSIISVVDRRRFQDPELRSYGLYLMPAGGGQFRVGGQISADGTARRAMVGNRPTEALSVGRWYQVAVIVARHGDHLEAIWLVRDDERPADSAPWKKANQAIDSPPVDGIFTSGEPLLLGKDAGRKATGVELEFDEVRLYDRALTEADLQSLRSNSPQRR